MAAPGAVTLFGAFLEHLAEGTIDFDTDTIKVALVSSGYTPNANTHTQRSDFSASELATSGGYTSGGATATPSVTRSNLVSTLDLSDVSWTGSGGGFSARYAVIYANVTRNGVTDPLIGYFVLDSAPADVTVAAGNTLTIAWNASGIATLTA